MLNWGKRKFCEDGSDWHESGVPIDNIGADYNPICTSIEQLPQKAIDALPDLTREHILHALKMGKNWLIEPLRELQPKSFAVLEEFAGDLKLGLRWYDRVRRDPPVITNLDDVLWIEVCGRVVVTRVFSEPYEHQIGSSDWFWLHNYVALPDAISKSWLWRATGWSIPASLPGGIHHYQMIGNGSWTGIDDLLHHYKKTERKKMLHALQDRIPNVFMTLKRMDGTDYEWTALRCFLDTRPACCDTPCGDQLLVVDHSTDQTVYCLHDGNVKNIRILHNPAEAIDAYCAHTLLRTPGRFDFMYWSEPLYQ